MIKTVAKFLSENEARNMVFRDTRNLIYEKGLDGRWHVLDLG